MLDEDVRGHIGDAIAVASLSNSQTVATILRRVNGATQKQLLAAAVTVLREQGRRIAELEAEAGELTTNNSRLKEDKAEIEAELEELQARLTQDNQNTEGAYT
jgi:hypothetical protein